MGTHYDGTPDERRVLDAYIKLVRAAESVNAPLERRLEGCGLTLSQFGVLEALYHRGPMCQRELGRKLLRSNGNITTVVVNLERTGLVRRERSGADRRYLTVHLTEAGRETIRLLLPDHVARLVELMGGLEARELDLLGDLCRKLGRHLALDVGASAPTPMRGGRAPRARRPDESDL